MAFGALSVLIVSLVIFRSPLWWRAYTMTAVTRNGDSAILVALGGLSVLDWKSFRHEAVVDRSQNIDF
jgi:hypothetical protein